MRSNLQKPAIALLALATLLSSCKEAKVRIYDVPKSENAAPVAAQPTLPTSSAPQSGTVVWQKAAHWKELAPTAFRKGNYSFASESGIVEITVSSFPGDTGGMLANVNRWLGQAQLSSITPSELADLVQMRAVANQQIAIVDLNADAIDTTRIYAAVLMYAGQSWFFKMSGPGTSVGEQISAFDTMIDTLAFPQAEQANRPAASPPAANSDQLTFTAPEGWEPSKGSAMRIASYSINKEGFKAADFSITSFPGDTGGTLNNVNRWRRQVGLPAWTNEEVQKAEKTILTDSGLKFQVFDLKAAAGEDGQTSGDRILVAILRHGGKSWFFKLRGEVFLLEMKNDEFTALLHSVHFHQEGDNSHNH